MGPADYVEHRSLRSRGLGEFVTCQYLPRVQSVCYPTTVSQTGSWNLVHFTPHGLAVIGRGSSHMVFIIQSPVCLASTARALVDLSLHKLAQTR